MLAAVLMVRDLPKYCEGSTFGIDSKLPISEYKCAIFPNVMHMNNTYIKELTALKSVLLPDAISIDAMSFSNLVIDDLKAPKAEHIHEDAFKDCVITGSIYLPILEVVNQSLLKNQRIKTVILDNAKMIGDRAFSGCTKIESVILPNALTIGAFTFEHCQKLITLTLLKAKQVHETALRTCTSLRNVIIPSAQYVGSLFDGLIELEAINIDSINVISEGQFKSFTKLRQLSAANATIIREFAFEGCISLNSFNLPKIEVVYSFAFFGCSQINSLSLDSLKEIRGNRVFSGMKSLTNLNISKLERCINSSGLFDGCVSLKKVKMGCSSPINFPSKAFDRIENVKIVIPSRMCLDTGNWSSINNKGKIFCYGAEVSFGQPDNKKGPNTTILVSLIVASIGLIILLTLIVFILVSQRRQKERKKRYEEVSSSVLLQLL